MIAAGRRSTFFAPWVNRIHFVTCGHYPEWLNLDAPKLNFVKHSDYIRNEYLPTFNANPIELNLHRIEGLSEQFVYFNDDMFLINRISPERFFFNNLPCDMAVHNVLSTHDEMMTHIIANDLICINSMFNKKDVLLKNIGKWVNIRYGLKLLRTLCLLPWSKFSAFYEPHLPNAFLKSTFLEVWANFEEKLNKTSSSRIRSIADVNQYLFRYWQLVKGTFVPYNVCKGARYVEISDDNINEVVSIIKKQKDNIVILNDSADLSDFEYAKQRINNAFEFILSEKSSFEL